MMTFEQQWFALRPGLMKIATRLMRNADDAEDVVGDTCLKLIEKTYPLDDLSRIAPRVLYRTAIDRLRAARLDTVSLSEVHADTVGAEDPAIAELLLADSLDSLEDDDKMLLAMLAFGMTQREVADVMGVPLAGVNRQVADARRAALSTA